MTLPVQPPHDPRRERDGPLSLSLSPSKGERVPKAGEGLVHGPAARQRAVDAPQGTLHLKAIATDVHFWVPVVVLLIGLTLLLLLG
jgi:hypothetical protein